MKLKFNGEVLTHEYILLAREYSVKCKMELIEDITSGKISPNDSDTYIKLLEEEIEDTKNGKYDHTFSMMQTAYCMMTGKVISFLP